MRVLFITHYSELFGANRSLLSFLAYLNAHHPEVEPHVILPFHGPACDQLNKLDIPFQIVKFNYSHVLKTAGYYHRVKTICSFFFRIVTLIIATKREHYDLIYSNSSVFAHGLVLSRILGIKHVWHFRENSRAHYNLVAAWGDFVQRRLHQKSEAIIYVSHYLKSALQDWNIPDQTTAVIYNGVFTEYQRRDFRGKEFNKQNIHLCYVGLMSEKKRAIEALELLHALIASGHNALLTVCARMQGAYAEEFLRVIKEKELGERVEIKGFVENVDEVISGCDFLVMPSEDEAMGRVTAEAMSVGVPVIGRYSGGTIELFEHGKSGIHYKNIHNVIQTIDQMDSVAYRQMSENAFEKAGASYSTMQYGQAIYTLLNSLFIR